MRNNNTSQLRASKSSALQKQSVGKPKSLHYLLISNQQFLRRNLMLLGVTASAFLKETKCSIEAQFFPKNQTNPTSSKQFFYISLVCLDKLVNSDEISNVQMWYPPRTANEQLQFKKAFFKTVQTLQIQGRVPKNMLVSKGVIMGEGGLHLLVEFLRFLSEMALRHQYLEKFSKRQRLIQLCCNYSGSPTENNINRFYLHPFVPSPSTVSFEHQSIDLPQLKKTLQDYVNIYVRKLARLRTKPTSPVLSELHQDKMRELMQQKQIADSISSRIPAALLSENRAFDRRRLMDRNAEIWAEIDRLECHFVEGDQMPTLKIEGEVDAILQKWQPIKGLSNVLEGNSLMAALPGLQKQLEQQEAKFEQLINMIDQRMNSL